MYMSNSDLKNFSIPQLKSRLSQMGMSLDRSDHPKNYYMKMYLEKSNAKNKITRDNTPFYSEQIISRKRERQTSEKKRGLRSHKKNKDESSFDEEDLDENVTSNKKGRNYGARSQKKNLKNENNKNINKDINDTGIKTTRLIIPKNYENKKYLRSNNLDSNEYKNYNETINLRSPRNTRSNNALNNSNTKERKNQEKDDYIYYDKYMGSKSKSRNKSSQKKKSQSKDKNIIKVGAQKKNNKNIFEISDKKSPNKDCNIINVKNSKEKPTILRAKKVLLKKNNDNIIDQYKPPEKKDIIQNIENIEEENEYHPTLNDQIIYRNEMAQNQNNNQISNEPELNDINTNPVYTDTSSDYSVATSRFSRFTNFSLLSLSRLGNSIKNIKNSVMNKFKKYAYLLPLVILILFGIVYFFNEKYENFDRMNIIIIFSILMGLIILFNFYLYLKELQKYKNMAKKDKEKLMEKLNDMNIRRENIGNNIILLNQFIEERTNEHGISYEKYMKYVFPYLVKYLKKDGFYLEKQKNQENQDNDNYWKKI